MLNYPQVALAFMNRDHAEFVAMHDGLLRLLDAAPATITVDEALHALHTHTLHHFAEEERLMLSTHFPPYRMHQSEHTRVLADMEARHAAWIESHDAFALKQWLQNEVAAWFVNHVSTMDLVTAQFIAAQTKAS
ncbi:MAG: hemerythrin family protein [Sideroxydans sp.]|nr:hemerythrin family protein [Sideroxydans sp.]NOT98425.1 hemerythrin family protein [Sideroxydans sp.]